MRGRERQPATLQLCPRMLKCIPPASAHLAHFCSLETSIHTILLHFQKEWLSVWTGMKASKNKNVHCES